MTKAIEAIGRRIEGLLRGAIAALLAGVALGAGAQNVQPSAGLKWQWMHEIVFNSTNFSSTGTPEERSLLEKIWAKEIDGAEKSPIDGTLLPSFVLIGTVGNSDTKVILTMLDRAGSDCISPGNGRDMVDLYSTCPLRLLWLPANGQVTEKSLPTNFCMLFGDDPNNPRIKNHDEYAFDERSGIIYLRTVQHGKLVPACNRALRVLKAS